MNEITERLARVEEQCRRLPGLEAKLDRVAATMSRVETKLDQINGTVGAHEKRLYRLERWGLLLVAAVGLGGGTAARMLGGG